MTDNDNDLLVGTSPRGWRSTKGRVIIAVVVVVVLAGAGIGTWLGTRTSSAATSPLQVKTEVTSVTTGTMKETVSTSGTLEPASEANLNFAVSGQVTAVDATVGEKVTAGQVLATVDPTALQDQVDAAEASLSAAEASYSTDESSGASASQLDSDEAAITQAQNQLTEAQTNLADASLVSTIAGTVASVDLSVGQQVSGSGGGGGGAAAAADSSSSNASSSAQIVVVGTNTFAVSTTVSDTQVGEVKVGDQAVITPGSSSSVVYGLVSSVSLLASDSSGVATFPVTVTVTGSPGGLYAGSTASVSIIVKQLNNVVEVPTSAVSYSNGNATVTEVIGGRHVTQPITTGATLNGETQVTSGLRAGDQVLEQVVTFHAPTGGNTKSLFGGGNGLRGSGNRTFVGPGGGGFPGGGAFGG